MDAAPLALRRSAPYLLDGTFRGPSRLAGYRRTGLPSYLAHAATAVGVLYGLIALAYELEVDHLGLVGLI